MLYYKYYLIMKGAKAKGKMKWEYYPDSMTSLSQTLMQ